ncbi:MAG: hypothetical protein V1872_00430 [bacterium]
MRKIAISVVSTVVSLAFIVMGNQAGASNMNLSGEYRVRGYVHDYVTTANQNNSQNYWDQRFRLTIEAIATDNLKGVVQMDIGAENGTNNINNEDRTWGAGEHKVLMRQCYLDFNIPETPLNLKFGTQPLALGYSLLLDTYLDALLLTMNYDQLTIYGLAAKDFEGDLGTSDDEDYYGLILNFSTIEKMTTSLYGIYLHDGAASTDELNQAGNVSMLPATTTYNDLTGYWIGLSTDIAWQPLDISLEIDYMSRRSHAKTIGVKDYKEAGWASYLDIKYTLTNSLGVGVQGIYATGDDPDSTGMDEGFKDIAGGNDFIEATWEEDIVVSGNVDNAGLVSTYGVKGGRAYAMLSPMNDLSFKGKLGYYWREVDPAEGGKGNEDDIGLEIDGFVYYNIYENLKFKGFAGYLFSDEDALGENAEDVWRMGQRVTYYF